MQLEKMNPGSLEKENAYVEHLMKINGAKIEITDNHIKVTKDNKIFIDSPIDDSSSSDFLTRTDYAKYSNGQRFRIIRASEMAASILDQSNAGINFTISSISGDGYSAQFMLVDKQNFNDQIIIESTQSINSKAEQLAIAASGVSNTDADSAIKYLQRFFTILENNHLDFLRVDETQNLINGHIMAMQLGMYTQDVVAKKLKECRLNYSSAYHVRWQGDDIIRVATTDINGRNFAKRGIVVEPNFADQIGFVVYLYNADYDDDMTESNMQMSPKTMKTYEINSEKIAMRGFGSDYKGQNNSDFGIVISFENNAIHHIELHMIDRDITIGYYN